MAEVSAAVTDMSRKIERTILQALAERGQAHAAGLMGVSESAVSRMKDGQLEALAVKVVPAGQSLSVVLGLEGAGIIKLLRLSDLPDWADWPGAVR